MLENKKIQNTKKNLTLIYIITVVYNNATHLKKTFDSIFFENYKNYELIVIDGNSNDGTVEIIKKNSSKIKFWLSELGKGIYDAFNKEMKNAQVDYLGFVNSDDILLPNALQILNNYIQNFPEADLFFGAVKKH